MTTPATFPMPAGDVRLQHCRLTVGGRELTVAHTAAVVTHADEAAYLGSADRLPYGVVLWPAALALAHEIATRAAEFAGRSVLELGAGTGLPGIVAATLGARVVQTDRQEQALALCRLNGERNGAAGIECRAADWTEWTDAGRYDWVIASDVLYAATNHPHLRHIFETNVAPGGRVLLADPYRADSLPILEAMERDGWRVTHARWTVGDDAAPRAVAVYELTPPGPRGE